MTRLLALQAGAFLFAELAERGFDLTRAFAEPAVGIGLVLQAAIALLLAFSLGVVAEVARAIARRSKGIDAPSLRPVCPPGWRLFARTRPRSARFSPHPDGVFRSLSRPEPSAVVRPRTDWRSS